MTYFKLVTEVAERYEVGTSMADKPWIKSYSVVNTEYGDIIVARKLHTEYYDDEAEVADRLERDADRNAGLSELADKYPELANMSKIKTVYCGKVQFDNAFVDEVKEAAKKCRSFGEFNFAARKAFRKETINRLGGDDREQRDYIRWALSSN